MELKRGIRKFFRDKKGNMYDFLERHFIAVMVIVVMVIAFFLLFIYLKDDLLEFLNNIINFRK